jgi:predicted dehydrogenase
MQSGPIQVTIVGCGAVAEMFYAPALKALEKGGRCEVVALVDPNQQRSAQLQREFPGAKTHNDLNNLTGGERALAIIATPVRFHCEQTIRALNSGLSVLCEKPMAASVAESEAMIETAETRGKILAIGLYRRFFPATRAIRDLLCSGALGAVRSFSFAEGVNFNWPAQSASFFKRESAGGGVLIDIGAHVLDLVLWWFGQPAKVYYEDDAVGGVEANCRVSLKFSGDVLGEVRLSRDWQFTNRCAIECERGYVSWNTSDAEQVQVRFREARFMLDGRLVEPAGKPRAPLNFNQCFLMQLMNVCDAVSGTQPLRVTGETALASMKVIEHCYRHRVLMPLPWMGRAEYRHAQKLAQVEGML